VDWFSQHPFFYGGVKMSYEFYDPNAPGPGPDWCENCGYRRSCGDCYEWSPDDDIGRDDDAAWNDWWESLYWFERWWILAKSWIQYQLSRWH
jgi:hypothetical protein